MSDVYGTPAWLQTFDAESAEAWSPDDFDAVLDVVFERIDTALKRGNYETVDALLAVVDTRRCCLDVLLTFWTATLAAADQLPARPGFEARLRSRLAVAGLGDVL